MGLRELAESDLRLTLEDNAHGFGWSITVTDPAGLSSPAPPDPLALYGRSDDIGQVIDPDTGVAVSGRLATVTLRIASLTAAGLDLPESIADAGSKPWQIGFSDINGNAHDFAVMQSNPDRGLGIVTCILEVYEP